MKKRTLLLTLAILALLAVPAVAMALNTTPPAVELPAGGDGSLGWMDEMHGLMWDEGAFSEGGSLGWMDEMHGLMWDEGAFSEGGSLGWMDEMHGSMWDEGAFPGNSSTESDGASSYQPSSRMGMAPSL
jgi:hypothetical protein